MAEQPREWADDADERATLTEMLEEARALVTRLETALWRSSDPGARDTNPVRYWRKQRRMSQTDLARIVGVTPAAICRIEHAERFAARPDTRDRICAALDIPVEWLSQAAPQAGPASGPAPAEER